MRQKTKKVRRLDSLLLARGLFNALNGIRSGCVLKIHESKYAQSQRVQNSMKEIMWRERNWPLAASVEAKSFYFHLFRIGFLVTARIEV
jgi:hypothetical protein